MYPKNYWPKGAEKENIYVDYKYQCTDFIFINYKGNNSFWNGEIWWTPLQLGLKA